MSSPLTLILRFYLGFFCAGVLLLVCCYPVVCDKGVRQRFDITRCKAGVVTKTWLIQVFPLPLLHFPFSSLAPCHLFPVSCWCHLSRWLNAVVLWFMRSWQLYERRKEKAKLWMLRTTTPSSWFFTSTANMCFLVWLLAQTVDSLRSWVI